MKRQSPGYRKFIDEETAAVVEGGQLDNAILAEIATRVPFDVVLQTLMDRVSQMISEDILRKIKSTYQVKGVTALIPANIRQAPNGRLHVTELDRIHVDKAPGAHVKLYARYLRQLGGSVIDEAAAADRLGDEKIAAEMTLVHPDDEQEDTR